MRMCCDWFNDSDGTHGCVDIVVSTPSRLLDHLSITEGFTLEHLSYLVLDEADRLLTQNYRSWLNAVFKSIESKRALDQTKENDGIHYPHVLVQNLLTGR